LLKKRQNKPKTPYIEGIIIPAKWDDKGTVTGVTIQTFDEKVYLVEHTKTGDELLGFIRKKVKVSGKIRERLDGNTLINVHRFEIIDKELTNHLDYI